MEQSNEIFLQKLLKYLEDDENILHQQIIKFCDSIDDELTNFKPREHSLDGSEFPNELQEYHMEYCILVEKILEGFLSENSLSNLDFIEILSENCLEGNAGRIIDIIEGLVDYDVFCYLVQDVKNGNY